MAEGRSRSTWSHTSTVLAMIANVNRDPKKSDPFRPSDFDPHAAKPKAEKPKSGGRTMTTAAAHRAKTGR